MISEKQRAYVDFLKEKAVIAPETGFDISPDEINPILKPHQRDAVLWAIKGGRRAIFESFGLGKTIQQLEIVRIILKHKKGLGLIVCPLGVKQEFVTDAGLKGKKWEDAAAKAGLDIHELRATYGTNIKYIKRIADVTNEPGTIYITNYERVRDGDIDPNLFTVITLDEASVLRSYGSLTYQTFLQIFQGVQYKYVCTATPSPNKFKELIHYAGYLEIMDTGQALTRFFQRDSTKANNLTLYPHKAKEFWLWLSTWAVFITKPSDLGYSDEGYDMPPFDLIEHCVEVDHEAAGYDDDGQAKMFRSAALGLKDAAREKRDSLSTRIEKMKEIVENDPDNHYIIWHDLEAERHAIMKALPKSKYNIEQVYGTQDLDQRESFTLDFSEGRLQYLATKPEVSGSGSNFQYHCHKAIFLGIGYKFNDFIQAIHRIYRFQQKHKVEIHLIYAESEQEILKTLYQKWEQHKELVKQMTRIMKENGLNSTNAEQKLLRSIGLDRKEVKGKLYTAINNDCAMEAMEMPENSIDLVVTSIPFSNHYEYTPSYNDFGHTSGDDHFFRQMDFLTPELLRTLKPGRLACVHVKDRILFGNTTGTGMSTVNPFHAHTIFHYMKHGFQYMGMITIETDVVRENNQTYRLGWTEQCKDGSKMGVGSPEYVLLFRKLPSDTSKAYADTPVTKTKKEYPRGRWQIDARAKWNSSGDRFLTPQELQQIPIDKVNRYFGDFYKDRVYDFDNHIEVATTMENMNKLPAKFETLRIPARTDWVWGDVNRMLTLNGEQSRKKLQMHVCPLQFDIVDRLITRYSNPGELVYDPFGGLMTVPVRAMKLGRRGIATELNAEYFRDGVRYCQAMESKVQAPTLFDLVEEVA